MQVVFHHQAIIINEDGKILALLNRRNGKWDLPGGTATPPELHSVAVRRLIKEQLSTEIWDFQVVGVDTVYDAADDTYHVFVGYMAELKVFSMLRLSGEYGEFRWLSLQDFRKLDLPLNVLEFVVQVANARKRKIKSGNGILHILD